MNARTILNPELRQRVAHLTVNEIKKLHDQMAQDVFQLSVFLKLATTKKAASSAAGATHPPYKNPKPPSQLN